MKFIIIHFHVIAFTQRFRNFNIIVYFFFLNVSILWSQKLSGIIWKIISSAKINASIWIWNNSRPRIEPCWTPFLSSFQKLKLLCSFTLSQWLFKMFDMQFYEAICGSLVLIREIHQIFSGKKPLLSWRYFHVSKDIKVY